MGFYKNKRVGDPKWVAGDEEHDAALAESGVSVDALSRTSARPIRWLVENIIPHEAVTLIAGDPGAGKSFFACQLAADATRVSRMRVVLAISGDESAELLRWRLEQAEGDSRRVALARLRPDGFYDKRGNPTAEELDERMAILYETLQAAGDPKSGILPEEINVPDDSFPTIRAAQLLVIDDIDGWFGKPGNLMPAAALARAIQRLNELARSLRVAVVVLARTQLSVEGRMTSRQLSRLSQAANVVWMIVKDREGSGFCVHGSAEESEARSQKSEENPKSNPGAPGENPKSGDGLGRPSSERNEQPRRAYSQSNRRWFLPVKNNLAADVAVYGRAFEIYDGQIRWHGDDPAPSLAEVLLPSAHNSDRRRVRHAAMLWIERALADGPLPSKEFYQQGIDNGHSKGTLVRAATELGIHPTKTGFNGGWEMRWVPQPVVTGRGTTAKGAGAGFKIVGGEWESGIDRETEGQRDGVREGWREGAREGWSDGATEGQREGAIASCASSQEPEESCEASCASSTDSEEFEAASCASSSALEPKSCGTAFFPHPSPLPEGEGTRASCASSVEVEKLEGSNCESSAETKEFSGASSASSISGAVASAAAERHANGNFEDVEEGDPKSKIQNQKSPTDHDNVYDVIVDALQEACLKEAG